MTNCTQKIIIWLKIATKQIYMHVIWAKIMWCLYPICRWMLKFETPLNICISTLVLHKKWKKAVVVKKLVFRILFVAFFYKVKWFWNFFFWSILQKENVNSLWYTYLLVPMPKYWNLIAMFFLLHFLISFKYIFLISYWICILKQHWKCIMWIYIEFLGCR